MTMTSPSRLVPLTLAMVLLGASLAAVSLTTQAGAQVAPATLVLRNGRVVTADDARPDAQAIAVNGDTIVALGTNAEIGRRRR